MYMYVQCINVCVHVFPHVCVCMCVCMCTSMYTLLSVYTCTCMYVQCINVCVHVFPHVCVCVYMCFHMCECLHMYSSVLCGVLIIEFLSSTCTCTCTHAALRECATGSNRDCRLTTWSLSHHRSWSSSAAPRWNYCTCVYIRSSHVFTCTYIHAYIHTLYMDVYMLELVVWLNNERLLYL